MANSADLWKAVSLYEKYVITSHARSDLDAVGSEIALALFLEKLGKESRIINESPLPAAFEFLGRGELVLTFPEGTDFDHEAVICLDAPDMARTGAVAALAENTPLLIVDHHPYENSLADVAWIDPTASSTGELLFAFMREREELIDREMAGCLYAAIMADTGRFTFANTTRRTLETAAALVSLGAVPSEIARAYYENLTDSQMYLFGAAASAMKRAAAGRIAYTTLSREDFDVAGAGAADAQELAELPRLLGGVDIGALLRDVDGNTKVSLRSRGSVDAKEIAEHFGGGGHRQAAGFFLELPLAEAEIVVVRFLEDYLEMKRHC